MPLFYINSTMAPDLPGNCTYSGCWKTGNRFTGCLCSSPLGLSDSRSEIYRSPRLPSLGLLPRSTAKCLSASLERLPRLSESESLTCRSMELLGGLTARGGDLEDDFLTTRGTPPELLLLSCCSIPSFCGLLSSSSILSCCGILGTDDLRASGWLWRDVAGPGLENVDEKLLRAKAGIGNWNQLVPRVLSAASSAIGI